MRNVTDFGLLPKEHLVTELKKALGRITDLERACQLEHALAEEALCQTDKKYHTIFENAIIGIFKTTLDGKIISANPMMATLFCYESAEELMESVQNIGMELFKKPEDRYSLIRKVSATDGFIYFETEYFRKNGTSFMGALYCHGIRNSKGEIINLEGFIEDISKQKAADAALAEQKIFAHNLIQGSAAPTFVIDCNHNVIIWNKACEELTGIKGEEIIGTNNQWKPFYSDKRQLLADIIVDENHTSLPNLYENFTESKFLVDGLHVEKWFYNLNGKERYVSFNAAPIRNHNKKIIAAIETFEDISDIKMAEKELLKSEKRHRSLFEDAPVAMLMIDPDSMTVVESNEAATAFYKYSKDEFVGKSMADIVVMPSEEFFSKLKNDINGPRSIQLKQQTANGDVRDVEFFYGPISFNNKKFLFSIINDITESKNVEGQLKHAQKMEAVGVLAGGIAHDFNNILTAIMGYASLLSMSISKDSPLARNVNGILSASERAAKLTKSLLAFSRKKPIEAKPVNLNDIVNGVGVLFSNLLRENIELKIELTDQNLRFFRKLVEG